MLKFPIISPRGWRLYKRLERLKEVRLFDREEDLLRKSQLKKTNASQYAIIKGIASLTLFLPIKTIILSSFICLQDPEVVSSIPVSQVILPPGQLAPRGARQPRLACPPGGKLSRDILPPTLVIFTPGGQAVQAGLSCPQPNTSKNIYMLFCYFSVSF